MAMLVIRTRNFFIPGLPLLFFCGSGQWINIHSQGGEPGDKASGDNASPFYTVSQMC